MNGECVIAVLVPVLGRPGQVLDVRASLRHQQELPTDVLFLCSPDDGEGREAAAVTGERVVVAPWEPGPGDYARKINLGFGLTDAPYVFQGATDLRFHSGWDVAAVRCAERTGAGVVGTQDLANPLVKRGRHSTHSLIRRSYVEEHGGGWDGPGIVLHEGYDHQYVDNELVHAAMRRSKWAFAGDALVEHRHPMFFPDVPRDSTYDKALRAGREDGILYRQRERTNR